MSWKINSTLLKHDSNTELLAPLSLDNTSQKSLPRRDTVNSLPRRDTGNSHGCCWSEAVPEGRGGVVCYGDWRQCLPC